MSMRWQKVAGDLRVFRVQIILLVVTLALGAAGVTAALNAQAILKREIALSFSKAHVPDLAFWFERAGDTERAAIAGEPGVVTTDARRMVYTRIAIKDGSWLTLRLIVVADLAAQKLNIVHLHAGTWPDANGAIFIEQSAASMIDADVGQPVRVRKPNGETVSLPLAGFVHDPSIAPSTQERMLYAYVTPTTAQLIGQSPVLDQVLVKLDYRGTNADANESGNTIRASLARKGFTALRMDVLPNEHPHGPLMAAMLRVLGVLSVLAFVCSVAMAGYVVAAWMRREVRIVGIMKAMGACAHQIATQYLALVGPVALFAVLLATPLGHAMGLAVVRYYAISLNIDIVDWDAPSSLLLTEVLLSLTIPLIAMTIPIVSAARMTAYAAIQDAGIVTLPAGRLAARLLKVSGQMRLTLALRNTWRRPWRLSIMLLGLSAGGGLLLMTHSNYESLIGVIDISLNQQGHDIDVSMQRAVTAAELEAITRPLPEVSIAEAWRRVGVGVGAADSATNTSKPSESRRVALTAYPPDSRLFRLPVVHGRAPVAGTSDEILVTRALQDTFPEMQTGRKIKLQYRERRTQVTIVGIVEEIAMPNMYSSFDTYDAVTGLGDKSSLLRVKVSGEQSADHIELSVQALDRAFLAAGMAPSQIVSRVQMRDALDEHMKVVLDVVRMVALTMALVGAIMLAATTILNILERSRESGIMRTLGATPKTIASIFLIEGASVTFASFVLSIALSIPLTLAMLSAAEKRLLHMAVPLQFSWFGLAILLSGAIVVLLAVLICVMLATRKSVREAIAYE